MKNQDAIVYLEGQWDCMCSEDCKIYTGHKDCPQGFICSDGQALQMAISALQAQDAPNTNVGDIEQAKSELDEQSEFAKSTQQTNTDTIYRQSAIDALKKISFSHWFECGEYLSEDTREIEIINSNKAFEAIEALPSAQPEQPKQWWIPCSERLPEVNEKPYYIDPIDGNELFESEQVLVFGKNENGYDYSVASHIYSTKSGDEWGNAYDSAEVELITILAWMPLPEPYRAERRIDNANVDA